MSLEKSFDGAETCELIGIFLLSQINQDIGQNFVLYRDDGLGIVDTTLRVAENMKKRTLPPVR